jgi:hypothetical protein
MHLKTVIFRYFYDLLEKKGLIYQGFKNWTAIAATKLAVLLFHMCNIQPNFLVKRGVKDFRPLLYDFKTYNMTLNSFADNNKDPDLENLVVPDFKKVRILTIYLTVEVM